MTNTTATVGFIGGGRVARIILGGFKKAGQMPHNVVVSDTNAATLDRVKAAFPEISLAPGDNRQPAAQDVVFLGLHPPAMSALFDEIKTSLKPDALVISLAPKVSIAGLSSGLGGFQRIVRMIPNAPSIINAGYNPVAFSAGLTASEKAEIISLLSALGECPEVAEDKLEAYAILTAMGPTYLWFQLYELRDIAESFGMTRQEVEAGIVAMVAGAVKTMMASGLPAEEVMDLVPSKPLKDEEENIRAIYRSKLNAMFQKLKG